MKFLFENFNKTGLCYAVGKNNLDVVKLLLSKKNIDVNYKSILLSIFYIPFR